MRNLCRFIIIVEMVIISATLIATIVAAGPN